MGIGTGQTGTIVSFVQRLTMGGGESTVRLVAGAGVAYSSESARSTGPSLWLNADVLGVEIRTAWHMVFFAAGGWTYGLFGGTLDPRVAEDGCPSPCRDNNVAGYQRFQTRIGIGGWFWLPRTRAAGWLRRCQHLD